MTPFALTLPSLAGVPIQLASPESDPLVARCALAVGGPHWLPALSWTRGRVEIAALTGVLGNWLDRARKTDGGLGMFDVGLRVLPGEAPPCDCNVRSDSPISVWIGNHPETPWRSVWYLERQWHAIERAAPGLAETALAMLNIASRRGLPIYTPFTALDQACWTWWQGEMDESEVLEMMRAETDPGTTPEDLELYTRGQFDAAIPPCASQPKMRIKGAALARLARKRGDVGELARALISLQAAITRDRRRKERFALHASDDDGYRALGWAATLRWNAQDPVSRLFDDDAEQASQCGADASYGWFILQDATDFPALLAEIECRFAVARSAARVIPLIAGRARSW